MIERGHPEVELSVSGGCYGETARLIEPTVFLNPRSDTEIYNKHIFAPVAVVKTFETEKEALRMANDSEYGLLGGIFTSAVNGACA